MIAELFLKLLRLLEFVTQILRVFLSYQENLPVTRWQTDKCITSFLTKTCMISSYVNLTVKYESQMRADNELYGLLWSLKFV